MTTIVYRDGVMAADTLVMNSGVRVRSNAQKIHRTAAGQLIGGGGDVASIHAFFRWMEEGGERPSFGDDFEGIVVEPDGSIFLHTRFGSHPAQQPYIAIGCGFRLAMGALWMGATAEQAVQCCIELDAYTGGSVQVVRLGGS